MNLLSSFSNNVCVAILFSIFYSFLLPVAHNLVFPFNQKCTTSVSNDQTFTCFQLKGGSNYNQFLGDAARFSVTSCDRETFENEQPLFWYIKEASDGADMAFGFGRPNTHFSASFDPSEADKAFYSTLGVPPVPDGSEESDGGDDNNGGSGVNVVAGSGHGFRIVLSGLLVSGCVALLQ